MLLSIGGMKSLVIGSTSRSNSRYIELNSNMVENIRVSPNTTKIDKANININDI